MSKGEKCIHVYQIELEPYESGHFYRRDNNILTLTTDQKFPFRTSRLSIVSSNPHTSVGTVAFRKTPLPYTCGDKLLIPTFGIIDEEWDNEITIQAIGSLQAARGVYDDQQHSLFITRKKFESGIWEAGLGVCQGYGGERFVRLRSLESYLNHLLEFGDF